MSEGCFGEFGGCLDDLWVKSCLLIGNLVVGGWEDEGCRLYVDR